MKRSFRFTGRRALLLAAAALLSFVLIQQFLLTSSSSSLSSSGLIPRLARDLTSFPTSQPSRLSNPSPSAQAQQKKTEKSAAAEKNVHVEGRADETAENDRRLRVVKEMMFHAWYGYRNYTWGLNEVRPISKTSNNQAIFGGEKMAATIIDAADTLWIMGMTTEFEQAREFIVQNFSMKAATGTLSVFETTIRFVGGLLSLRALTGQHIFAEKAQEVMSALLPAFSTPTGIPKSNLDLRTGQAANYGWANGGSSILAEIGSLHLELVYLSEVTKQPIFAKKAKRIRDALDKVEKVNGGLYSNYINPNTGKWAGSTHVSVGALGDSFYEYLIKSWLQSNKKDVQAERMYWDASAAIQQKMVSTSRSGLKFVGELRGGRLERKMGHLACFCVGMFALEAHYEKNETKRAETMQLAESLGLTCHESYVRSKTRIGPEMFYFNDFDDATSKNGENGYILRPEVLEGFFYLWRLTKKQMYRDWVWDAISAMNRHCRVDGGFAGLVNVYQPEQGQDDVQQSFFLAETLKYAYLSFADESVLPLSEWVFNTEAHPLPVLSSLSAASDS